MASPHSLGSSLGSSLGATRGAASHPSVETHIQRSWQFDEQQHKTKCQSDASAYLEERLQQLAKAREPSPADTAVREAVIERLRGLLPALFPAPSRLALVPYGSFLSTCYSRGSDLDLALSGHLAEDALEGGGWWGRGPPATTPLEALTEREWVGLLVVLADGLEARGMTRGPVTRILEARVPIIKFVEASSGIECDVCVTTRGCDFKGAVMRLLHELQPALAPLVRLVKLWAKAHDINSAHAGTLNSWSLALMALWALQTYPPARMLPPLWALFHEEEPAGAGGAGRPLQDKSAPPDRMLAVAAAKVAGPDRLLVDPRAASAPPPLSSLLLWFLSAFGAITGQWRDNASHRNWRVSPWLGRGCTGRFPKAYVAAVEEPFDANDNTARSVGIKERNENTLPYIAWVFGHSVHVLRNVASVADAARVLAWLFGPEALPCVGRELLQAAPPALTPQQLQRLRAAAAATPSRTSGSAAAAAADGAPGGRASSGGAAGGEGAEEEDAASLSAAFRTLLDGTRVGSPIATLEEWRHHHAVHRTRPPHAWHRATPPPPPQQQRGGAPAPGAAWPLPPTPPPPPPLVPHQRQQQQQQQPQPLLHDGPPHSPQPTAFQLERQLMAALQQNPHAFSAPPLQQPQQQQLLFPQQHQHQHQQQPEPLLGPGVGGAAGAEAGRSLLQALLRPQAAQQQQQVGVDSGSGVASQAADRAAAAAERAEAVREAASALGGLRAALAQQPMQAAAHASQQPQARPPPPGFAGGPLFAGAPQRHYQQQLFSTQQQQQQFQQLFQQQPDAGGVAEQEARDVAELLRLLGPLTGTHDASPQQQPNLLQPLAQQQQQQQQPNLLQPLAQQQQQQQQAPAGAWSGLDSWATPAYSTTASSASAFTSPLLPNGFSGLAAAGGANGAGGGAGGLPAQGGGGGFGALYGNGSAPTFVPAPGAQQQAQQRPGLQGFSSQPAPQHQPTQQAQQQQQQHPYQLHHPQHPVQPQNHQHHQHQLGHVGGGWDGAHASHQQRHPMHPPFPQQQQQQQQQQQRPQPPGFGGTPHAAATPPGAPPGFARDAGANGAVGLGRAATAPPAAGPPVGGHAAAPLPTPSALSSAPTLAAFSFAPPPQPLDKPPGLLGGGLGGSGLWGAPRADGGGVARVTLEDWAAALAPPPQPSFAATGGGGQWLGGGGGTASGNGALR